MDLNMTTESRKAESPPYIAYSTFMSFIKGLASTGIPSRIDKSLLRNMSGTNQSSLISALKWFELIDEDGAHGNRLERLVASSETPGPVLRELLPSAYKFMSDGSIDLGRATGAQVEEKFKAYGVSGETVVKAMSFFIAACREAGIALSAHVKPPKSPPRPNGAAKAKRGRSVTPAAANEQPDAEDETDEPEDVERFEIPIPGKASVKVIVPADLDADDWEMLQSMISVYIKRWKGFKDKGGAS